MRVRAEERRFKTWQLVATSVVTLATSCTGTIVSVVVALKKDNVEQKVDALTAKLETWEKARTQEQADEYKQKAQVELIAEFQCAMNGGPPTKDFPCPQLGKWRQPAGQSLQAATQGHTTDRRWVE